MNSNYKNYSVEDFAQHSYFQKWVRNSDEECDGFWSNWMNSNSDRMFDINEAVDVVRSMQFKEKEIIGDIEEKLWDNIRLGIKKDNRKIQHHERESSYKFFMKIAAVLIPLLLIGYVYFQQQSIVVNTIPEEAVSIKKVNPSGKKTQFTLSDGTRVFLNSNSNLTYSSHFNDEIIRKVKLKGEAFFIVKRDEQRPFIVESGKLQTQVLGTAFNVRAFDYEDAITVSVEEGRVQLQNKTKSDLGEHLILQQSDMGVFEKKAQSLEKLSFDGSEVFDWRNGIIHFKRADFQEIKRTLEQWYGVSFEIERTIDSKKDFTGSYPNKPLSTVLDGLKFVYDFNYEINNKIITIN